MRVEVDDSDLGRISGRAHSPNFLVFPASSEFVPRLKDGRTLKIYPPKGELAFTLDGSEKAINALLACGVRKFPRQPEADSHAPTPPKRAATFAGSGFFIDRSGHLLTNNHVVEHCTSLTVEGYGVARLIRRDSANDLAVLRVEGRAPADVVKLRASALEHGEKILVIGFPLSDILGGSLNITTGLVSSLTGPLGDSRFVQVSAAVQPGNSGGPLVDSYGLVVGIVTARLARRADGPMPENVNFALRAEIARNFLLIAGLSVEDEVASVQVSDQAIARAANAYTVLVKCVRQ